MARIRRTPPSGSGTSMLFWLDQRLPTATACSGSWIVISPCPATAALTKFCFRSQDLALSVDRHHGQRHADRTGHVFETVGSAGIGAAVVVDLVAAAEAVPHVDAFHHMVENDRAVRLHFMHAPDLDRGGCRLGRLRAGGDRRADPAAMDHGPAERIAGMKLVAEEVFLGLGLASPGALRPGPPRRTDRPRRTATIQQPCRSSFLDSFRESRSLLPRGTIVFQALNNFEPSPNRRTESLPAKVPALLRIQSVSAEKLSAPIQFFPQGAIVAVARRGDKPESHGGPGHADAVARLQPA